MYSKNVERFILKLSLLVLRGLRFLFQVFSSAAICCTNLATVRKGLYYS